MMVVNLQLSRHKVHAPTDLFANAFFLTFALTADFLFRRHIVIVLDLRKRIQAQLSVGTLLSTTGSFFLSGRSLSAS